MRKPMLSVYGLALWVGITAAGLAMFGLCGVQTTAQEKPARAAETKDADTASSEAAGTEAADEEPAPTMDSLIDKWGKELGYETWPGKDGAFKGGFKLDLADYSLLNGFTLIRTNSSIDAGSTTTYTLASPDDERMIIEFYVSPNGANNAQGYIVFNTFFPTGPRAYVTGKKVGIDIGDVSVVNGSAHSGLWFARNNIYVAVRASADNDASIVFKSVQLLAQAIDDKIKAMPDLNKAEFEACAPTITASLSKDAINWYPVGLEDDGSDKRDFTNLTFLVTAPNGHKFRTFAYSNGALTLRINPDSRSTEIDDVESPLRIYASGSAGDLVIRLIAISDHLRRTEHHVTLKVIDNRAPDEKAETEGDSEVDSEESAEDSKDTPSKEGAADQPAEKPKETPKKEPKEEPASEAQKPDSAKASDSQTKPGSVPDAKAPAGR